MDFPRHIETLPHEAQEAARVRFLLRLGALHYSRSGNLKALSLAVGLHANTLASVERISAELAVKLEDTLGKDLFPRSLFRPDLFSQTSAAA